MAFHIYPDEPGNHQERPLSLAAGASTGLKTIGPLAGSGTAVIRIAWRPAGGSDPLITLRADSGDETAVPIDGMAHAVFTRPAGAGSDAGDAILDRPVDGVYRLRIFLQAAATWQIDFKNTDGIAHTLTWVVADSDADSQQPWIHATLRGTVPADIVFTATVGQNLSQQIEVTNLGTGPLTISGLAPAIAPPYTVAALPVTLAPNAAAPSVVTIGFRAPNAPGDLAVTTHTLVTSNKADPGPFGAGHNNRLSLRATTTRPAHDDHDDDDVDDPPGPCRAFLPDRTRCRCATFVRRGTSPVAVCARPGCGHGRDLHNPI